MKYVFEGPRCTCTEINPKNPDYKIIVPIKRMAKEGQAFIIDSQQDPTDKYQWVTIYINKKNEVTGRYEMKPVDILCDSSEQLNQFIADIQAYHESFMKKVREDSKKPWMKTARRMAMAQ